MRTSPDQRYATLQRLLSNFEPRSRAQIGKKALRGFGDHCLVLENVLVTGKDKPFTGAGFGNWFRDRCRKAELPRRCTSHGLRKTAATYLAEQGATDHQLMA